MKLHPPFIISARLLPALQIGDAWLSLDHGATFWIDLPDGTEHRIEDFHQGAGNRDLVDWFSAILSFLSAAVESRNYREQRRESEINPDGNEGLFPPDIVDWACENSSGIECAQCDISDECGAARSELIEA